jgi:hypothetical protein
MAMPENLRKKTNRNIVKDVVAATLVLGQGCPRAGNDLFELRRTSDRRFELQEGDGNFAVFADQVAGDDTVVERHFLALINHLLGKLDLIVEQRLDHQGPLFRVSPVVIGQAVDADDLGDLPKIARQLLEQFDGIHIEDAGRAGDDDGHHLIVAKLSLELVKFGEQRVGFTEPNAVAKIRLQFGQAWDQSAQE